MIAAAIVLLGIGSVGIIAATVMEARTHEAKYKLMMKIAPLIFGIGAVLLALVLRT